jgi:YjbE family integral membrane protein
MDQTNGRDRDRCSSNLQGLRGSSGYFIVRGLETKAGHTLRPYPSNWEQSMSWRDKANEDCQMCQVLYRDDGAPLGVSVPGCRSAGNAIYGPDMVVPNHPFVALLQVILIDITLAGDNAIVVGLAASRVAPSKRSKVVFWGIVGAVVLRVLLAAVTLQLIAIVGLTLAGGILLLWVCWKLARELGLLRGARSGAPDLELAQRPMPFWSAVVQIIVADVSMSLDNVLAVAGAAKGSLVVLVAGLAFSIALMAAAATLVAKLLARHRWVAWLGLAIILYVAVEMIWRGALELGLDRQI